MKALFIPLKRCFFEAFERGEKTQEFRLYGARWNERTYGPGRAVTLSLGYSGRRLAGVITGFERSEAAAQRPEFRACYGDRAGDAAVISICVKS